MSRPVGRDPRHRTYHCLGACRHNRQRSGLPQRPAIRCLARPDTPATLHRWRASIETISKRGDTYLRTLLVHGTRSGLRHTAGHDDAKSRRAESLKSAKFWSRAAVALANKHARIAWAMLANGREYEPA